MLPALTWLQPDAGWEGPEVAGAQGLVRAAVPVEPPGP